MSNVVNLLSLEKKEVSQFHESLCQVCHGTITRFEITTPHTSAGFFFFFFLGVYISRDDTYFKLQCFLVSCLFLTLSSLIHVHLSILSKTIQTCSKTAQMTYTLKQILDQFFLNKIRPMLQTSIF